MNWIKAGILFFILWLIQTTLLWSVWPLAAAPSLLLCAAVCFVWLYDSWYGLVYALVFGLLIDIQTQNLFGVCAVSFVLAVLPAMGLRLIFNHERALPVIAAGLAATIICAFANWGINHVFGAPASVQLVLQTLPALLVSHAVICLLLHIVFVRTIIKHRKDRRYVGGVM